MTIAIASYQRRDAVLRLLRTIDAQASADRDLAADLDVVVVLDGSSDGSKEAIEAERWTLPTRVVWQPNRGLAAARNTGLRAATGAVVWLLDDDIIPTDGVLARHRAAHVGGPPTIVVGRCQIPEELDVGGVRAWWDDFHGELAKSPTIERFDLFTAANTSGPRDLFLDVGGFDERFRSYGFEDFELAHRLLLNGVPIRYDGDALALHPDVASPSTRIRRRRSEGANAAKLAAIHPELRDALFPVADGMSSSTRFVSRLGLRRARSLDALAEAALGLWWATKNIHEKTARQARRVAAVATHAAGVASEDPTGELLTRVLGPPRRRYFT